VSRGVWLALAPRDSVLVRDGRSFDAGVDATAETTRPWPSTIAGAVGAAYGREPQTVRGPVLARGSQQRWTPHFPMPADVVLPEVGAARAVRLPPTPTPVTTDLPAGCPQWLLGMGQQLGGWLPSTTLGRYLRGELFDGRGGVPVGDLQRVKAEPFMRERRVGLARTASRTARTGFLYQATHLRLHEGWAFLAECELTDGWDASLTGPVRLGGRGRLADVGLAGPVDWPAPPAPEAFREGRVLVYVATPALWPGGWRLPEPDGARLIAAAVNEPEPVATASEREGFWQSRRLRWAVPVGSVYLLEFDDGERAAAWAGAVHTTAWGRAEDDRLRTAGFGVVLTGVWS
jgi:CRISPR-associated protein Cmr3